MLVGKEARLLPVLFVDQLYFEEVAGCLAIAAHIKPLGARLAAVECKNSVWNSERSLSVPLYSAAPTPTPCQNQRRFDFSRRPTLDFLFTLSRLCISIEIKTLKYVNYAPNNFK